MKIIITQMDTQESKVMNTNKKRSRQTKTIVKPSAASGSPKKQWNWMHWNEREII